MELGKITLTSEGIGLKAFKTCDLGAVCEHGVRGFGKGWAKDKSPINVERC